MTDAREPCADCLAASQRLHVVYRTSCRGCLARMTARGLLYFKAREEGRQTKEYLSELRRIGVTHAEVKAAADADWMTKGAECSTR